MRSAGFILFIFLILLSPNNFAQTNRRIDSRVDSLKHVLATSRDSVRVKVLLELTKALAYIDASKASEYCKEALQLARKQHFDQGIAKSLQDAAMFSAWDGNYSKAVKEALQGLHYYQSLRDSAGAGDILNELGIINRHNGNYEKSLEYYRRSLSIAKKRNDQKKISMALGNIGLLMMNLARYDSSLIYNRQSLKIDLSQGNMESASDNYYNIGLVYYKQKQYDSTLTYYKKSLRIDSVQQNHRGMTISLRGMGDVYLALKNYGRAIFFGQKALAMADRYNLRSYKDDILNQLSAIYTEAGNYKQAYQYLQQHTVLHDSIFNEEKSRQIAEMESRFDLAQKDQKISAQQGQIELFRKNKAVERKLQIAAIALVLLLVIVLIILFNRYQLKRRSEKQLQIKNGEIATKNQQIEVMNKELEQKALRAQMDPHFIFNSLNSIQHFITTNEKTSALKYLSRFSKLIRQTLENSINDKVPIAEEISLLRNYLDLEALRLDHKFDYEIQVDPEVDIYNSDIPFLLIQPYVENAIVHGLKNKEGPGHLIIKLTKRGDHMLFIIEDNGIGRKKALELKKFRNNHHNSVGMTLTERRIQLLGQQQNHKTKVHIEDLYDGNNLALGTRVEIEMQHELT